MHVPESGANLLARIKMLDDVVYDALARAAELDTTASPTVTSPSGDTGVPIGGVLRDALLWRLAPGGPRPLKLGKRGPRDRDPIALGLGWTKSGTHLYTGDPAAAIAARFAVLARFMPAVWQAEAELGLARFKLMLADLRTPANVATMGLAAIADLAQPVTVQDLFRSEAAVASLLDHHINVRGDFPDAIGRAVRRAVASAVADRGVPGGGPIPVDDLLRLRILIAHQGTRQLRPDGKSVVKTGADRAAHLARDVWCSLDVSLTQPFPWPP
jgi:hypothetical protein